MANQADPQRKNLKKQEVERSLRSGMSRLDKVLPRVLRNSGLEKRLREHALFELWPCIAGAAFAHCSRPVFIDGQKNLVVTVSDAAAAQELMLSRSQLVQVIAPAAQSAGIEIRGIRVDLKHFHTKDEPVPEVEEISLPEPDEQALNSIELGEQHYRMIEELKAEITGRSNPAGSHRESINKRILSMFEKQLRLEIWRKANHFPSCQQCGFAVSRLHQSGKLKLCFNCHLSASEK